MNYEDMSDLEINRLVADHEGGYVCDSCNWMANGVRCNDPDGWGYNDKDYCGNPDDAWPIIIENKITLLFDDSDSCELSFDYRCVDTGEILSSWIRTDEKDKILRAAMICYLMMKDKEDE